jgi:fluoroquinolone transport system permease protein
MIRILNYSLWQLRLLTKYQIILVAFIIAAAYTLAFKLVPVIQIDEVLIFLIFSDPTLLGFIFIGAMILFEKTDQTLSAQVITPLRSSDFLWAKAFALLVPALICSLIMMIAGKGIQFRIILFILNTGLSSLIFTFLGIVGVMHVKTFNQYLIIIPLFLAPTSLPLLNFFGLTNLNILYIIPTQSTLYLFEQILRPPDPVKELACLSYLALWVYLSYRYAKTTFEKKMYQ